MRHFKPPHLFAVLALLLCQAAGPPNMKERVGQLELYPLRYGPNSLTVNRRDVLIVRGAYRTDVAWGGDEYVVLMKQGEEWQVAHRGNGAWDSTIIAQIPHTYEDGVVSVRFMVPKTRVAPGNMADLYLLMAERHYQNSAIDSVPVEFTLYVLSRENDDFGVLNFRTVKTETSKMRYCSSDLALYRELGLPLPGSPYPEDERAYSCP